MIVEESLAGVSGYTHIPVRLSASPRLLICSLISCFTVSLDFATVSVLLFYSSSAPPSAYPIPPPTIAPIGPKRAPTPNPTTVPIARPVSRELLDFGALVCPSRRRAALELPACFDLLHDTQAGL